MADDSDPGAIHGKPDEDVATTVGIDRRIDRPSGARGSGSLYLGSGSAEFARTDRARDARSRQVSIRKEGRQRRTRPLLVGSVSVTVFVDTSAFYAVLDRDDANHEAAGKTWVQLLRDQHTLLTTNYVLLETCALLQSRLGITAWRAFHQDVVPLLQIDWISKEQHSSGVDAALTASRKRLSVADCIAFQTLQRKRRSDRFLFRSPLFRTGIFYSASVVLPRATISESPASFCLPTGTRSARRSAHP